MLWIIISKKPGLNQWHYPDTPALFTDAFQNPEDSATIVACYKGDRTAAEMSATEYTGEFPKDPNAIRVIAPGSFQRRFNDAAQDVRSLIRDSADNNVINLREDLELAMYIDLDDEYTVAGINYLGALGWLTDAEVLAMLADGTEAEKYNGPL